jgi:type IV pilus assembly protein PilA
MPAYGGPPIRQNRGGDGFPTWAIILIVVILLLVVGGGIMAVLSIYGVRKYIANAKTAEARNTLGQIAKDAAVAYENEGVTPGHHLCPSASSPVPANKNDVSGKKYMSTQSEWDVDRSRNAGFACLRFSMETPQYYQYNYASAVNEFTATARGDLNGDGVFSRFEHKGRVQGDVLLLAPAIEETNPEE